MKHPFPAFSCSDKTLTEIYAYRVEAYQKHITATPQGYVVTEFLPPVPWAGVYNTINCPASHHFYDGRWMCSADVMEDYARFWFTKEAQPRQYSFPAADSIVALAKVHGNWALAESLYPALCENYRGWQQSHQRKNGLYFQIDDRDGMEYSISGSGLRPTINAYQYADAKALSLLAARLQKSDEAANFAKEAAQLKERINTELWNTDLAFYENRHEDGTFTGVREEIGYIPWMYHIPPVGREAAFDQLWDKDGFYAPFGPTTAERRHPDFMKPFAHECLWNGPSWPFATTQTLQALRTVLQEYPQQHVTEQAFMRLLSLYAHSQYDDGKPFIDENIHPDTGAWIARDTLKAWNDPKLGPVDRGAHYNHSGFMDLIFSGVCGILPQQENSLRLSPLGRTLSWFCAENIPYHGHTLQITWQQQNGLCVRVDGKAIIQNSFAPHLLLSI